MGGSFDSANYLRGLGWSGPGFSLNGSAHGRAKPITVVQKKTLAGVGRDRDTSFAWWDAIFTSVASKVGGEKKSEQQRLTSTGILSHRPPAATGSAYQPEAAASSSRLNLDAMAAAKIEYARRQLYSGFLRGTTLKPDEDAKSVPPAAAGAGAAKGKENAPPPLEAASKKRERDEEGEGEGEKGSKAERKEERRKRREEKAAKKAAKEEKRAAKARKEKGKGKEEGPVVAEITVQDDGDVVLVDAVEVSTTNTPPAESDPSSSSTAHLSKEDRRAAKKLRKSLAALAPSASSSTASATPVPRDYLSLEEALAVEEAAYLEAKAAAKRAEKEERRLAKVVKKALKEQEKEKKRDKA
ncbi:hypothetical protein JCM6882_004382 [Rhodosporidiobolus microsporus]